MCIKGESVRVMIRLRNNDGDLTVEHKFIVIVHVPSHHLHRIIASSSSHCRIIASSSSHHRVIAIASWRHRHCTVASSLHQPKLDGAIVNYDTKALKGHGDFQKKPYINRYIELCNPFSRISNSARLSLWPFEY